MCASCSLAFENTPQLGHGKVWVQHLNIALNPCLGLKLDKHWAAGQHLGMNFSFAWAVATHGVQVRACSQHARGNDECVGFVGGHCGHNVSAFTGLRSAVANCGEQARVRQVPS